MLWLNDIGGGVENCFVGGGAKSAVACQILADITGKRIETIKNTQNVGTIGATVACAVGLGVLKNFRDAKPLISVDRCYEPMVKNKDLYQRNFDVFKGLYKANKGLFHRMNRDSES